MLFESVEQMEGPIKKRETTFEFLQRGGRKEAVEIRKWMESWFRKIPHKMRLNLESRLKGNYSQFLSAFFEIEIHEMLRRLDYCVEFEPSISETRKQIDFFAQQEGQGFYIEATVCGIGQSELIGNSNENDVVEKIKNKLGSIHSDIWLEATGELEASLRQERVIKPFHDLLNRYTADEVREIYSRCGELGMPYIKIKREGWILKGKLMPCASSYSQGQIWGPLRSGAIDGATPMLRALCRKTEDWKKIDFGSQPFLIAINVCHPEFLWEDVENVLFGDSNQTENNKEFRKCLSRVDGVIVFDNAVLGRERDAPVQLYRNGNKPIPDGLQPLLLNRKLSDLLGICS